MSFSLDQNELEQALIRFTPTQLKMWLLCQYLEIGFEPNNIRHNLSLFEDFHISRTTVYKYADKLS